MPTVAQLLRLGRETLRGAQIEQPGRESAHLLGLVLDLPEGRVLARDREPVPEAGERSFRSLIERRAAGEPLAYLLGRREFFGRPFLVDDRVLIPRPETEHLVELGLGFPIAERVTALDVGTGSGCIAVTLAAERPLWRVLATDVSRGAAHVARANAARLGVEDRVSIVVADLAEGIDLSQVDLVLANVPYVEEGVIPHLSRVVRDFEPWVALSGGPDGLSTLRRLLGQLSRLPGGAWVALEFGFGQEDAVAATVSGFGTFTAPTFHADLAGIRRDVVFRRRP